MGKDTLQVHCAAHVVYRARFAQQQTASLFEICPHDPVAYRELHTFHTGL